MVKAKTIKEWLKDIPDDFPVEFLCNGTKNWEVSFTTAADSNVGLTSAVFDLSTPLDPNVTYIL